MKKTPSQVINDNYKAGEILKEGMEDNKKMRVIDLLVKIANGEEVPKKFRFAGQIFEKQGSYIEDEDGDSIFESMCSDFSNINEEVEVIEDKKIEKIDLSEWAEITYKEDWKMLIKDFNRNCNLFVDKINEIIKKMNKGE